MARFRFKAEQVAQLVKHSIACKTHRSDFIEDKDKEAAAAESKPVPQEAPGLHFCKDDGVYLMSNGTPVLQTDVEGKPEMVVAFARGYSPATFDDEKELEAKIKKAVGEFDGSDFIPITEELQKQLLGDDNYRVKAIVVETDEDWHELQVEMFEAEEIPGADDPLVVEYMESYKRCDQLYYNQMNTSQREVSDALTDAEAALNASRESMQAALAEVPDSIEAATEEPPAAETVEKTEDTVEVETKATEEVAAEKTDAEQEAAAAGEAEEAEPKSKSKKKETAAAAA